MSHVQFIKEKRVVLSPELPMGGGFMRSDIALEVEFSHIIEASTFSGRIAAST